jgi:glycosyltransferase involved in cell wall biosynthesis
MEVAKRNPNQLFVVTGKEEGFTKLGVDKLKQDNILFTGYLTDGEIKSLMQHCKAFIHPAIYEGFGIPPLEAMSCGANVIVSTATCLPEIYGDAAHFIDPYNYDVDLESLIKQPVAPRESVLDKYNWAKEAEKLLILLRS